MLFSYPFDCHLDRAGHAQSCALRGGTGTAVASSTSNSPAKLFAERLDFVFGFGDALRISELFGFFELFAQFLKLTPVRSLCLGVNHFASVFRSAGAYGNDDLASTTSGGFARMEDQAQRPNPWVKRRESFEFTTILSLNKSLVLALARSEYAN